MIESPTRRRTDMLTVVLNLHEELRRRQLTNGPLSTFPKSPRDYSRLASGSVEFVCIVHDIKPLLDAQASGKLEAEGGEVAMTDRILEWLRLQHDDPGLRTERGIAAMLEMERNGVRLGLYALKGKARFSESGLTARRRGLLTPSVVDQRPYKGRTQQGSIAADGHARAYVVADRNSSVPNGNS